ncbi:hypothetical protein [Halobacillus salinus]|uniref:hypothetical protein n=1 Tax=Halobacillus salinus TaxID=192814 RepID=UPI0009A90C8D|nr:hypothetical protein [Halobacillus salinus]
MGDNSKPKFFKRKRFWIYTGVCVVIFVIAYFIGSFRMTALLDDEVLKYDELVAKAESKDKEIQGKERVVEDLQAEIDEMNGKKGQLGEQIESKQSELDEAVSIIESRDSISEEIVKLKDQRKAEDDELSKLKEQVSSKEKELALVTGKIIELQDKPKSLAAGFFTVGTDIPASRYKVTPNGDGNFFVNDGMKVNVMIGRDDDFYLSEYIFYAEEGDVIELTTPATFQPVQ